MERRGASGAVRVDTRGRADPSRHRRRAVSLLLFTLVLPGSAQLAVGNRQVGRLAMKAWAGILAAVGLVGLLALVNREAALTLLTYGWSLAALQVILLAAAAGWGMLLVDAWRLGRPRALVQRDRRGLLALLVGLLMVPVMVGWMGMTVGTARSALTSVFAGGEAVGAVNGRYNILMLGGDSGAGRTGLRPDSIQLASVDAASGRAVLLGFSRETENIHFNPGSVMAGLMPEGWICGDECLLNGLYTWAVDHKEKFPPGVADPGVLATKEAVEWLTGLTIQYHVIVDLKGFSSLIDAVDGLDINVQRRTPIGGNRTPIKGYIEAGQQHLDGYHALWYSRSRVDSTNYERMARQRCVVTALVEQLDPKTILLNFGDIANATKGLFQTDIPQAALASLADVAVKTKQESITSVNFVPPLIKTYDYDVEVFRSMTAEAITASEKGPDVASPKVAATDGGSEAPAPAPSPSTPAVMERPGTDPDANTRDLATVCAAG